MKSPKDFVPEETVYITFKDGDKGLIDFNGLNSSPDRPIVFLAHGLGGCSESLLQKATRKKID